MRRRYSLGADLYICKPTALDEIFAAASKIVAHLNAIKPLTRAGAPGA